jgi:hypothetical protein
MRTPCRALPSWPYGFDDARGNPFAFALVFAAGFDFSFTTFFVAALVLAFCLLVFAIAVIPPKNLDLD